MALQLPTPGAGGDVISTHEPWSPQPSLPNVQSWTSPGVHRGRHFEPLLAS
jgi:hypothetical protein